MNNADPITAARHASKPKPVTRPTLLHLAIREERQEVERLLADETVEVHDTIQFQLRELVQTRQPEHTLSAQQRSAGILALLDGRPLAEYGAWAHYPWSRRLVHVLGEDEFIELRTNRNRYLITQREQDVLREKRIGIVGLSVGQSVALAIALERGCGELRLADHDTLDLSNLNRLRAGLHELGDPKAAISAREIAEMDPYLRVTPFFDGLAEENMARFFTCGGKLDLVIDECDGLDMKVRLREVARELGIPVVMQTSDRGMIDIERFDLEPKRALFHGLAGELRAADLKGLSTEDKVPPLMKIIGVEGLSTRIRASLLEVERSIRTWPQLGSAVTLGGGLTADTARRILLGQLHGSGRWYVDLGELVGGPGFDSALRATLSLNGDALRSEATPFMPSVGRAAARPESRHALISRALLAPSAGNHQLWSWVTQGNRIALFEDPAHRMGLGDYDNLGTAVGLGAAAENLVLAAHAEGLEVRIKIEPSATPGLPIATFELSPTSGPVPSGVEGPVEPHDFDDLEAQIERRHTDRRLGGRGPLPAPAWEALQIAALSVDGVGLRLVTDRAEIEALATLIGEGDRLRMLDPTLSREMFSELRWSKEEAEATGDGLEVDSLALSAVDRVGLELCRSPEALALVAQWDLGSGLTRLGRKWATASSALGLLTVKPADRASYFRAGRAMERLWLTATREGLALHPLTFLPYAFARLLRGGGRGFAPGTAQGLAELRAPYARLLGLDGSEGEVLLFRLFRSTGTTLASVRRPAEVRP